MNDVTITTDYLMEAEAKAIREVLVMCPIITIGPTYFKEIMKNNIHERNIEYKYLIGDDPTCLENLEEFIEELELEGIRERFQVRVIPQVIIEGDVTIHDPDTSNEAGYVLSPIETTDVHWRLMGSALYHMKTRFNSLWRVADPWDYENEDTSVLLQKTGIKMFRTAFHISKRYRKKPTIKQWEVLGKELIHNDGQFNNLDYRQVALNTLLTEYSQHEDICPPLNDYPYPEPILDTCQIM